ncbi:MAG TPA: uracil phosphoribosyltransferase, partial [bacterium]|nr:uracil phosphoribosyltransferase [bacterium]
PAPTTHPLVTVVNHPVLAHALAIIRQRETDPAAFRDAARQIAIGLLLEATRDLPTVEVPVQTPLMATTGRRLAGRLGVVPILRAGLGFMEPVLTLLPGAEIWHLGIFRDEESLQPVTYYNKLDRAAPPDTVIVVDPMLATGGSASATLTVVKRWGQGSGQHATRIKYACIIAAPEGIARLQADHPEVPIYTAAVDQRLNEVGYILPGLGDAGDRLFNTLYD